MPIGLCFGLRNAYSVIQLFNCLVFKFFVISTSGVVIRVIVEDHVPLYPGFTDSR